MGCSDEMVGKGVPVYLEELAVELYGDADEDECDLRLSHPCLNTARIKHISLNQTKEQQCDDGTTKGWTYKYIEYISSNFVRIEVCTKQFEEPEPEPDPEPDDLTDYARIERSTQGIVAAALDTISGTVLAVGGVVDDFRTWTEDKLTAIDEKISDTLTTISELLTGIEYAIISRLEGVLETLTGRFDDMQDTLDAMEFPSLDGVKQAFLDVCTDLALALWDCILDKIEERYPDDEEGED